MWLLAVACTPSITLAIDLDLFNVALVPPGGRAIRCHGVYSVVVFRFTATLRVCDRFTYLLQDCCARVGC